MKVMEYILIREFPSLKPLLNSKIVLQRAQKINLND